MSTESLGSCGNCKLRPQLNGPPFNSCGACKKFSIVAKNSKRNIGKGVSHQNSSCY